MKTWKIGDRVKVLRLNKTGIVSSISRNGAIKVLVGGLEVRVSPSDLDLLENAQKVSTQKGIKFQKPKIKTPTTLDLHGLNSESAKEVVLQFLSDSIMSKHKQVSIIHGHGSGVLKRLVHSLLSDSGVVASFRHPINDTAVTKVYLR